MENCTTDTQAILLLTTSFSAGTGEDGPPPLSIREWAEFAAGLQEAGRRPGDLLGEDRQTLLAERSERDRLDALLGRGAALGLALSKWLGAGLWILTRADRDYPARLKERLGRMAPPVLFGCGNPGLLAGGGIAVVGSRDADAAALAYATAIGRRAAEQGVTLVSGGARGVDEAAMAGALSVEGTGIGVLADGLLRCSSEVRYRPHLMSGDLVLVSPYPPEASFEVGRAMGRNRYIYCLSGAAVVVDSGRQGGTWSGATENLERSWVPLAVRPDAREDSGAAALVERGAGTMPEDPETADLTGLYTAARGAPPVVAEAGADSQVDAEPDAQPDAEPDAEPGPPDPDRGSGQLDLFEGS